ncbi:hypothetical protein AYI68_g229 [Smittium mucronatum]|uniref:Uncharacterized protein n=1 Tax=Smittium mucronatum TaxID=133383 RepID=A0A1R0H8Y7_9FUNG|nr:hypothetical protein AYI68_g229 [Smittium mucronatum]
MMATVEASNVPVKERNEPMTENLVSSREEDTVSRLVTSLDFKESTVCSSKLMAAVLHVELFGSEKELLEGPPNPKGENTGMFRLTTTI